MIVGPCPLKPEPLLTVNRHPLLLLLLLLTLLNHAVLACDSVVVHGNNQHHPVSGLTAAHQHNITTSMDAAMAAAAVSATDAAPDAAADEHAEPHAHVLCFVAYSTAPAFDIAALTVLPPLQLMAPTLNMAPPVPPPNS